jgi:hypothetical protein
MQRKNLIPFGIVAALCILGAWLVFDVHEKRIARIEGSQVVERFERFDAETERQRAGELETAREPEKIEAFNLRTGETVPDPKFGGIAAPTEEVSSVEVLPTKKLLTLPEDANTWHVSLFVQGDYMDRPREVRAVGLFSTEQWAIDLRHTTHFHLTKVTDKEARKFWKWVPETPCLIIQDPSGSIIYREANPELWSHPTKGVHSLRREIQKSVNGKRRHGNQQLCPGPDCPVDKSIADDKGKPPPGDEIIANKGAVVGKNKRGIPMGIALLLMGGSMALVIVAAKSGLLGAKFLIARGAAG